MSDALLLSAAFAAGFFGSAHCLGMCGGIVLVFETQGGHYATGWLRRLYYNSGRMLFYVLLGFVAGASGAIFRAGLAPGLMLLRVLAAVLILALGLNLLCNWQSLRFLERAGAGIWQRISPLARHVLPVSSPATALAAGFLWGAIPCGLVYSAVALAATSGSVAGGGLVMFVFWLGTLPAMMLAGASADKLYRWKNHELARRTAGVLLVLFGLIGLSMPLMRFMSI